MPYYYEDFNGKHKLTLIRGAAEWVNADCPSIYSDDGSEVYHGGSMTPHIPYNIDDNIRTALMSFFAKSSKAFNKRYPNLVTCSEEEFLDHVSGGE